MRFLVTFCIFHLWFWTYLWKKNKKSILVFDSPFKNFKQSSSCLSSTNTVVFKLITETIADWITQTHRLLLVFPPMTTPTLIYQLPSLVISLRSKTHTFSLQQSLCAANICRLRQQLKQTVKEKHCLCYVGPLC